MQLKDLINLAGEQVYDVELAALRSYVNRGRFGFTL